MEDFHQFLDHSDSKLFQLQLTGYATRILKVEGAKAYREVMASRSRIGNIEGVEEPEKT